MFTANVLLFFIKNVGKHEKSAQRIEQVLQVKEHHRPGGIKETPRLGKERYWDVT